ncbi:MAG: L-threonylcarbamoyladenylate synthase [bacterium]|nr:L-threonylcarbamoyladenylate synthase [bacterium]
MRVIKIGNKRKESIAEAVCLLRKGGILVYPTDTAYALGCDAFNKSAQADIFKIKRRVFKKPLPLIAANAAMVRKFCQMDKLSSKLAKKYWPGALTLVLAIDRARTPIAIGVRALSQQKTIAIRVSDCKVARLISQKLGRPIVSTSANLTGQPPCYSVVEVLRQLGRKAGKIDLILDGGKLPKKKSSTIVRVINGKIEVIRQGVIKLKSQMSKFKTTTQNPKTN